MSSSPTSQPVLSSLNPSSHSHLQPSSRSAPTPRLTAFVYGEKHSYRALMLLRLLGGEQRRFRASTLATPKLEELANCDFILLDAFSMTSLEVQEAIAWMRSATLAPLVVLSVRDPAYEIAALQAGADAVIAFSESLEVSLALCRAAIRRRNREW